MYDIFGINKICFRDTKGRVSSIQRCFNIISDHIKYYATEPQEFHYVLHPWQFTRYSACNRVQINDALVRVSLIL